VGHAGTLDPLATGLLVLCTGKSTRTIEDHSGGREAIHRDHLPGCHTAQLRHGNARGRHLSHGEGITEAAITEAAKTFEGAIDQIPPIFSAKMVEGERSYDLARKGEAKELKANRITITAFLITAVRTVEGGLEVDFDVTCSKGTYIRSLAHDLGQKLGCGGYLQSLRRTRIGKHKVEDALTAEQFHFILFGEGPNREFDGRISGRD
jgi:tRNA pseudouridine55 synthase